jgi:hypothetical protein
VGVGDQDLPPPFGHHRRHPAGQGGLRRRGGGAQDPLGPGGGGVPDGADEVGVGVVVDAAGGDQFVEDDFGHPGHGQTGQRVPQRGGVGIVVGDAAQDAQRRLGGVAFEAVEDPPVQGVLVAGLPHALVVGHAAAALLEAGRRAQRRQRRAGFGEGIGVFGEQAEDERLGGDGQARLGHLGVVDDPQPGDERRVGSGFGRDLAEVDGAVLGDPYGEERAGPVGVEPAVGTQPFPVPFSQ